MGKNSEIIKLEDQDEFDFEKNINQGQGVDIQLEKASLKQSKKVKKIKRNGKNSRNWGIIIFTMAMPIQAYILEYFIFFENLKDENGEYQYNYYSNLWIMIFVGIMNIQTYYKCLTTKNTPITKNQPNYCGDLKLEDLYRNDKQCEQCDKWKPIRVSHCSQCGKCVTRMDHHCPWIDNCVGQNNHQAFLLFIIYMAIGSIQYTYHQTRYFINLLDKGIFRSHNILLLTYWSLVTLIIVPMSIMLFTMTIFNIISLVQNITTLMSMGGYKTKNPFKVDQNPQNGSKSQINLWDLGLLANIAQFFNKNRLFFWFGKQYIPYNDGRYQIQNPSVQMVDTAKFQLKQNFPQNVYEKLDEEKQIQLFEDHIQNEIHKYHNAILICKDKKFKIQNVLSEIQQEQQKLTEKLYDNMPKIQF